MKCLLLGSFTFPSGMAASARVRNLAYGLRNTGAEVYIYSLAPNAGIKEDANKWIQLDDNLFYHHYLEEVEVVKWKKLAETPFYLVKLQYLSFTKMKNITENKNFDLVFIYGRGYFSLAPFFNYFNKKKVPIIFDVNELPAIYKNAFQLIAHPLQLNSVLGEILLSRKASLVTAISTAIQKRFPAKKTYLLPGIEDWNLQIHDKHHSPVFTFLYLGIFIEKDNPDLMLEFFEKLNNLRNDFAVKIAGKYNGYELSKLVVEKFRKILGEKLILVGELTDQELDEHIKSSDAILLLRQDNESEENSFPTRLVEYLKRGTMVITSAKGDLKSYLTHLQDAFLLPYLVDENTLKQMEHLIDNRTLTVEIGMQGFLTGKQKFNRDIHAEAIIERLNLSNIKQNNIK